MSESNPTAPLTITAATTSASAPLLASAIAADPHVSEMTDYIEIDRARLRDLEAELARIRPVYEAACAWRDGPAAAAYDPVTAALETAVDHARTPLDAASKAKRR
jgi:hypothetical protein